MDAKSRLLGFGPFSEDIMAYLNYPNDCYKDVEKGREVVVELFNCDTTEQSRRLAVACGLKDIIDFNNQLLKRENICFGELEIIKQEFLIVYGYAIIRKSL